MLRMASAVSGAVHRCATPWVRRIPSHTVRTSGFAAGSGSPTSKCAARMAESARPSEATLSPAWARAARKRARVARAGGRDSRPKRMVLAERLREVTALTAFTHSAWSRDYAEGEKMPARVHADLAHPPRRSSRRWRCGARESSASSTTRSSVTGPIRSTRITRCSSGRTLCGAGASTRPRRGSQDPLRGAPHLRKP
jgi:hypothetical protein